MRIILFCHDWKLGCCCLALFVSPCMQYSRFDIVHILMCYFIVSYYHYYTQPMRKILMVSDQRFSMTCKLPKTVVNRYRSGSFLRGWRSNRTCNLDWPLYHTIHHIWERFWLLGQQCCRFPSSASIPLTFKHSQWHFLQSYYEKIEIRSMNDLPKKLKFNVNIGNNANQPRTTSVD